MAKPEQPRPMALVLERAPWTPDHKLAAALREDLTELLQFVRLRVMPSPNAESAARSAVANDAPALVCFTDVPGLPPDCIDGAIEMLEDLDVVIGPGADGSVYLLGIAVEMDLEVVTSLIKSAATTNGLAACIALCEQGKLVAGALPPWFRVGNEKDLSFAENLARLSLLGEDGDMDFFADRLRLWFENRSEE